MNNYIGLFYLYLSIVCLLLFTFSIFVSLQLRSFLFYFLSSLEVLTINKSKFIFSVRNYQNFYYYHSRISDYFLFISLSEFCLESNLDDVDKKNIYFSLARIYRELSLFEVAEYYYLEALSFYPQDLQITLSLVTMYNQLRYPNKAKKIQDDVMN